MKTLIAALLLLLGNAAASLAAPSVGFIIRMQGEVQVYTDPSVGKVAGEGPHIKFDEKYYAVKKAKRGFKIKNGFVVNVGDKSKARVVFKNGDQITVSANSAYVIDWKKGEKAPKMQLFFGKVRSMIQKGGPRTGMEVRTRSAVMGVRGTDFHVKAWSQTGGTELTVLRGAVAVKQASGDVKPVVIPAGSTAEVQDVAKPSAAPQSSSQIAAKDKAVPQAAAPAIKVSRTTKQELVVIQHSTKVEKAAAAPKAESAEESADVAELEQLEQKAVEATMQDIKVYDPKLYETIQKKQAKTPGIDVDDIGSETVKNLFEEAPNEAGVKKPSIDDLDSEDVYDQYRWGED